MFSLKQDQVSKTNTLIKGDWGKFFKDKIINKPLQYLIRNVYLINCGKEGSSASEAWEMFTMFSQELLTNKIRSSGVQLSLVCNTVWHLSSSRQKLQYLICDIYSVVEKKAQLARETVPIGYHFQSRTIDLKNKKLKCSAVPGT